jgi:hypothetical protein
MNEHIYLKPDPPTYAAAGAETPSKQDAPVTVRRLTPEQLNELQQRGPAKSGASPKSRRNKLT